MYRSNVRGHYALIQTMLPVLRKAPGQIVFINSSAGLRSPAGAGQFSATQHAFRSIADSLRDEVNADGIRVLSIYPGPTATPRMEKLFGKEGRAYKPELLLQPEDIAEMVTHALRLPRTAEVIDISIRPMQKSYLAAIISSWIIRRKQFPVDGTPRCWADSSGRIVVKMV